MRNADMGLLVQTLTRGWRGKGGRAGIAERLQWRREGDAARDAKNWTAAAHAYERHLNLTLEDHAIWVQYGHALKEAGSFERALAAYEQADLLKPSDRDLTTHLHHLRQQLGGGGPAEVLHLSALANASRLASVAMRVLATRAARPMATAPEVADIGLVASRLEAG